MSEDQGPEPHDAQQPTTADPPDPAPAPTPAPVESASTKRDRVGFASMFSNVVLMLFGALLAAGGYGLARVYAPPRPPGEVSGPPVDAAKTEDVKAVSTRVDHLKADLDALIKQVRDMPAPKPAPDFRAVLDNVDSTAKSVDGLSAKVDTLDQKLESVRAAQGQGQGQASAARFEQFEKQLGDVQAAMTRLRPDNGGRPAGASNAQTPRPADNPSIEGQAMTQAVELFDAKKYTQARDAFAKLQGSFPEDARIWYYSALANGFATNGWTGDTEKWVNLGLEKEKAGMPEPARIDAAFARLTPATGKDWLAAYRARINSR